MMTTQTTSRRATVQTRPEQVVQGVSWLRDKFAEMQDQLAKAQAEITRLRAELGRPRSQPPVPELDVRALRRRAAFVMHPDRGGDAELMSRLNAMFDYVETLQSADAREVERAA